MEAGRIELVKSGQKFPVIGIGASAGGLDAFKKFIQTIPEKTGMCFILVQHLHREHESALREILQRFTSIPIIDIEDNIELQPDHIFVIPSNKLLTATDGVLRIQPRPEKETLTFPINLFFSTLAVVHTVHAVGIILSGTGSDGTSGLRVIKEHGGITFAQDPGSAAYDAMPQNAINEDVVDFILPAGDIMGKLLFMQQEFDGYNLNAAKERRPEEEGYRHIQALLRVRAGVDFHFYKQTTVRRRILRRISTLKLKGLNEYIQLLQHNKAELDILFGHLLISITAFFRDTAVFDMLVEKVLPEMMQNVNASDKPGPQLIRIWIAGCATGQEAYSLAICLSEYLAATNSVARIQIFATDISEPAIKKARSGSYTKAEVEGIPAARLQQFFNKKDGQYQVTKDIRDCCIFAVHNFLKDPPFANINLLSCRNVLIYLEPFLQKKAFDTFHYSLVDKGILWLGKSETTGNSSGLFLPFEKKEKFYLKKTAPAGSRSFYREPSPAVILTRNAFMSQEVKPNDIQKQADDILLSRYIPPGVLVNEHSDIVQFRGLTGKYLEPAPGKPSLNVLKMAKDSLSFEIRNALHKARTTGETFIKENITIGSGQERVSIEVVPLINTLEPFFLVMFKSQDNGNIVPDSPKPKPGSKAKKDEAELRVIHLEKELARLREDMRSITEEQEAANEELQSANEELLSGSEELQSLNEELETSKEELQSTNEELITVNQELNDRNEELNESRKFAELVTATFHEPMIILDGNFTVKTANTSFYQVFNLKETDTLDKNLFELNKNSWNNIDLRTELARILLEKEKMLELELELSFPDKGQRSIKINMQAIHRNNGEKLILVALNDVTEIKEANALAEKLRGEDHIRLILESLPQITVTVSPEGQITFFNQYFLMFSGLNSEDVTASGAWKSIIHPDDLATAITNSRHLLAEGKDVTQELRLKRNNNSDYHWHLCGATPLKSAEGKVTGWICSATDIHEQKMKEYKKDEFISIASHEMKTPLTTLKGYLQLLELSLDPNNELAGLYTKKANYSVNRLSDLITELLDVSKIQSGKLNYNLSRFDFNALADMCIEDVQYNIGNHTIHKTGSLDENIVADKDRIQQVIGNLLNNAIKYSPAGGKIFVGIEKEDGKLRCSVRDEGIGIPKEFLGKVFERYYRVHEHAIQFQGLGIGLFLSNEIIERHNGRMWAESEPGKGSIFYFSLPIQGSIPE